MYSAAVPTLACLLMAVCQGSTCFADHGAWVVNGMDRSVIVWFKSQHRANWVHVPIPSGEQRYVEFPTPGLCYAVVRVEGVDSELGWHELHRMTSLRPNARVVITGRPVYETRTKTITELVPRVEKRTRNVVRYERIWSGARWVTVAKVVPEQYEVVVQVPEQREVPFTVTKYVDFDIGIVRGNELDSIIGVVTSERIAAMERRVGARLPENIRSLVTRGSEINEADCKLVNEYLARAKVLCDVTFTTRQPGADIYARARSESREDPIGISNVTKAQMPAGYYWVWAVRAGKNSRRIFAEVIREKESVYIPEE